MGTSEDTYSYPTLWIVIGLILGSFPIEKILSLFKSEPICPCCTRSIKGKCICNSNCNPADDSSGTSGHDHSSGTSDDDDSSGTSGEGSEWYQDRYKKNWRGKK